MASMRTRTLRQPQCRLRVRVESRCAVWAGHQPWWWRSWSARTVRWRDGWASPPDSCGWPGSSPEIVTAKVGVWVAGDNNPQLSTEVLRWSMPIRLDVQAERPSESRRLTQGYGCPSPSSPVEGAPSVAFGSPDGRCRGADRRSTRTWSSWATEFGLRPESPALGEWFREDRLGEGPVSPVVCSLALIQFSPNSDSTNVGTGGASAAQAYVPNRTTDHRPPPRWAKPLNTSPPDGPLVMTMKWAYAAFEGEKRMLSTPKVASAMCSLAARYWLTELRTTSVLLPPPRSPASHATATSPTTPADIGGHHAKIPTPQLWRLASAPWRVDTAR